MRSLLLSLLLLSACAPTQSLPPPDVDEARALLNQVIDAGLDRDFDRLCSMATGTCEGELEGAEHLAPNEPPRVGDFTAIQPTDQSVGGILFGLCGVNGAGDPYESEVLVFDSGHGLIATAAVYWTGTKILFTSDGGATTGGAENDPPSC